MAEQRLLIEWRAGRQVGAVVNSGLGPGVVLAHGAGGNLDTPSLAAAAQGLAARGFPVLRFNFPYRQEGRRIPDPAATLEECYAAVARQARQWLGGGPLFLGGRSMGGRMASHLAAASPPEGLAGLVFLAYPLHPPGRPEKLRDEHLCRIHVPMLFLSGTRDTFARRDLLEKVLERLPRASVYWLQDADHSFKVPGQPAAEVTREVVEIVSGFLTTEAQSTQRKP